MADKLAIFNELRQRGVFSAAQESIIKELESRGELVANMDKIISSLSAAKVKAEQERSALWRGRAEEYRKEAAAGPERLAAEQGPLKSFAIGAGKGFMDVGRGIARMTPFYSKEDFPLEHEKKYYGELQKQRPYSTTLGEIAGETAAFAPVGGAVSGAARLGKLGGIAAKVASAKRAQPFITGAQAAAETAIGGAGRGERAGEMAAGAGMAAAGGTLAHMAMPKLFKAGSTVYERLTGKAPKGALIDAAGQPTRELADALEKNGLSFDEFNQEAVELLRRQEPGADPEQAARLAQFEQMGYTGEAAPTQAHLRRTATGFQQQQEAIKKSGLVRDRIENINQRSEQIFDDAVKEIDPNYQKFSLESPEGEYTSDIHSHIVGRSRALNNKVRELYKVAEEASGGAEVIEPNNFLKYLEDIGPEDRLLGGLPSAVRNAAKLRGIIDADGNLIRKISATDAEKLVQEVNNKVNQADPRQRIAGRKLKDMIDDDVFSTIDDNLYKKAREFKAQYHKELESVKASEFSKRKTSLVKNILEDKITQDELFEKGVLAKGTKAQDIKDLKRYLNLGGKAEKEAGQQAWNKLRAETMQWIKDNSFKGAAGEKETPFITRHKFDQALKKIGVNKLKQIFEPEEIAGLSRMRKVLEMMEPVPGTQQGLGPSAQSVKVGFESLKRIAKKVPIFGEMTDDLTFDATKGMLRSRPDITKKVDETELTRKLTGLATGIAAGKKAKEELR